MRIVGNPPSGGKQPTTPTIGTATDGGTGTTVSVAFTPSTYIGKGTITYTATSSPGSLTGTGSGSPITVSGLTTGTTYSFTVAGTTNYGVSSLSSAQSNFVTPTLPTSFESIATATGTGSSGTITFSSIPSTYKHLQLRGLFRNNSASTGTDSLRITVNGSATGYTWHILRGNGTSATANAGTSATYFQAGSDIPNNGLASNIMGVCIVDIIDYASTSKTKVFRSFDGLDNNSTNGSSNLCSGLWNNTNAINSLTITTTGFNWTTSTQFALYGIK